MGSNLYSAVNRLRLGVAMSAALDRAMGRGGRCYLLHTKTTTAKSKKGSYAAAVLFSRLVSSEEIDDVKSKLDGWVKAQDKEEVVVSRGDLKSIIQNLSQHGRFARALEVFEWMNENGIYKFSPQDRALQLEFICRVRGCSAAERYFSSLPEQEKSEETYGTLVRCYVQQAQTEKALLHFQHMKELGFASSSLPYNEIMCLYAKTDQLGKISDVWDEMKKSKVSPDNETCRTCISSFGLRCDLDGMEKMLEEMESQPHIVVDWHTYAMAAKFYREGGVVDKAIEALRRAEGRLPKNDRADLNHLKKEVLKTWELEKTDCCNRCINGGGDYKNIIKSLVELGLLDEARKLSIEWEARGNWDLVIPAIVIEGYFGKALYTEAEAMVEAWERKEKPGVHSLWEYLSVLYQERDHMVRGFECIRRCANLEPTRFMRDDHLMLWWYSMLIGHSRGIDWRIGV